MTEEISITRALAELKLLDNRITKKNSVSEFVFFVSKKNRNNLNTENCIRESAANYQSVMDLIDRRQRLKNAIILSNAVTKVKIGNEEMSVAEVIERRQMVSYYKDLLLRLKQNRELVLNQVERHNQGMEADLQKILEINFGKANNLKTNSDDIENISKTYREHNKAEMIDGINVDEKIRKLEEIIYQYETESNFVLSESNAITKIKF